MRFKATTAVLLFLCFQSCYEPEVIEEFSSDSQLKQLLEARGGLDSFILPDSDDYAKIPQDPRNPLSRAKVELGKLLFHETALASKPKLRGTEGTYSCASCHHAEGGFQANIAQGIGEGGIGFGTNGNARMINPHFNLIDIDVQPIRTPSALNIAYQKNILWNGQFGATGVNTGTEALWPANTPIANNGYGFEGTETQAIAGLDVHRFGLSIDEDFIKNTEYKELFDLVYGQLPEANRYGRLNAGLAIAAYERSLLANQSPFQLWLKGNANAMSEPEKKGAILFFENSCGNCHSGPALSSMEFHAYGMKDLHERDDCFNVSPEDAANLGRGSFTKEESDNYKFKVPQLYNLVDSKFYGHGSSFESIEEVIRYKNSGIPENPSVVDSQLAEEFRPLNLTETEIEQLTTFIEKSLHDPNLKRYVPSALPSGNCFPNNDALSRVNLDCI